ncbi:MAG: hypothetical protein PHF56_02570 [Desulfuromonadaceae bacterium]|nr:hypothetical protein [Desulfuromonadaceae bacterium]
MKKLFLLCAIVCISLFGCGSETDGVLSLAEITVTDLTGGNFTVESSAIFISGKPVANTKISYTAAFKGTTTDVRNGELYSDSTGKVIIGPWAVTQGTVPIIITITAMSGDLSATKTASIPAATPVVAP